MATFIGFLCIVALFTILYLIGWAYEKIFNQSTSAFRIENGFYVALVSVSTIVAFVLLYHCMHYLGEGILNLFK